MTKKCFPEEVIVLNVIDSLDENLFGCDSFITIDATFLNKQVNEKIIILQTYYW